MTASPPLPEELLLDYAAGACSPSMDLLMATHLSMSEESRQCFNMLEALGGVLLETVETAPLEHVTAQSILEAADRLDVPPATAVPSAADVLETAIDGPSRPLAKFSSDAPPNTLQPFLKDFEQDSAWSNLGFGGSVAAVKLSASDAAERAHLLWAKPGVQIATHRHIGREVVLVLRGAFWDEGVRYGPGDVAVGEDGTIHAPTIDNADACLCLAVTEAPVQFVGSFGWMLNRFCRF